MGLMLGALNVRGEVAVVGRRGKQRVWDLAERWYPETESVPLADGESGALEAPAAAPLGVWLEKGRWHVHPDASDEPVPDRASRFSRRSTG